MTCTHIPKMHLTICITSHTHHARPKRYIRPGRAPRPPCKVDRPSQDCSADCQTGHWLSQDKRHHHKFLNDTIEHVDANPKELHPVLKEFQQMVEGDSRLYMLFELMFSQVRHGSSTCWHHPLTSDPGQQEVLERPVGRERDCPRLPTPPAAHQPRAHHRTALDRCGPQCWTGRCTGECAA